MTNDVMRQLRKDRDLSLESLGELVDLSATLLSAWERGKVKNPKRHNVAAVDDALDANGQILESFGFTRQGAVDTVALVRALTAEVQALRQQNATRADQVAQLERRIGRLEKTSRR